MSAVCQGRDAEDLLAIIYCIGKEVGCMHGCVYTYLYVITYTYTQQGTTFSSGS